MTSWPKKRRLIGTKVSRIDGPAKATGRAKYSYDINRPGMLHAVILRCLIGAPLMPTRTRLGRFPLSPDSNQIADPRETTRCARSGRPKAVARRLACDEDTRGDQLNR